MLERIYRGVQTGMREFRFIYSNRAYVEHIIEQENEKRRFIDEQIARVARNSGTVALGATSKFPEDVGLEVEDDKFALLYGRLPAAPLEPEPAPDTQPTSTT